MKFKRFTLRIARESESDKIIKFYETYPDIGLHSRNKTIIEKTIGEQNFFIVENCESNIVAAGAVFIYEDGLFLEAGADRVIENGFSLQKKLHYVRALTTRYFTGAPYEIYFAFCLKQNTRSLNNLVSVGFVEKPIDPKILSSHEIDKPPPDIQAAYLELRDENIKDIARNVKDLLNNPILTRPGQSNPGIDSIALDISIDYLNSEFLNKII